MTELYGNDNTDSNRDEDVLKPKKFVFNIYPENIEYIEDLTFDEKNDLVNQLIYEYREREYYDYEKEQRIKKFKDVMITILTVLIAVPTIFFLVNLSLNATKNSYGDMQHNFSKLFYDRRY